MRAPALLAACLTAAATAVTVVSAGAPVSVWGSIDSLHKCGVNDTPDIPARAFVAGDDNSTRMIVGSTSFHFMSGPSLLNQTRSCTPSWNSTLNPDPSMFAASEWLDSPHAFFNGTVVALVHSEFDAMSIQVPPCNRSYPYCWTVTIGLAVSYDWGVTWQHARPPPHHLIAAVPYAFNASQPASGWGDPSNIIVNPVDGGYYFGMWNRNQVGLQPPGICFVRTTDLTDPSSWRGWGGETYNISFLSPYTMPPGEAGAHVCTVAANLPSCMPSGLTWSTYLSQFVLTMDCIDRQRGVYISFSDDLVNWTNATEFYTITDLPPDVQRNVTSMTYPTFLDPSTPHAGANFMSIAQNATLFWSSIGHSPWTDGRRVFATPMTFTK